MTTGHRQAYKTYFGGLNTRLWEYAELAYGDRPDVLRDWSRREGRSPVFAAAYADYNLLCPPNACADIWRSIVGAIKRADRHKWFISMRSSQALAQSVFGALIALNKVGVLSDLKADDGSPALFDGVCDSAATLEYAVDHLGEPRPTSIDVWFQGAKRVAVECKFTETEFGPRSRPGLKPGSDPNYERDHCDGTYTHQRGRRSRCSLTEIGVQYWTHVPGLFKWSAGTDHRPCPLFGTYQLVRNILAACVNDDSAMTADCGHALVIYDARNPEFQPGGQAYRQYGLASIALRDPSNLRRCSWQNLVRHLARDHQLDWLVGDLNRKYGF